MVKGSRKTPLARPYGRVAAASSGLRPSTERLIADIDQGDPAFMFVAAELQQLSRIGVELNHEAVALAVSDGRRKFAQHIQDKEDRRPGRIPGSIVYYAQRGPLVKIGYTTQPHQRFDTLLPDTILAWEPGGQAEEASWHQQFRSLRVSSRAEFFKRDHVLDTHITETRALHGAPDPTWPTLRNLAHRPSRRRLPEVPVTALLVPLEAGTQQLGIRLGTARVWIHRKKLSHVLRDKNGVRLYLLSDLKSLAAGGVTAPRGAEVVD